MRLFKKILLIAILLLGAVAGVIAWKIGPRNVIGMLRYDQRKEGSLKVGDPAPDVSLVSLDGKTRFASPSTSEARLSSSSSAATPDPPSGARSRA